MITIKQKGNFKKTTSWFEKLREKKGSGLLDEYGRLGVEALREATPKDTGLTADSWTYEIEQGKGYSKLIFNNSNVQDGWANIAILLQYGHGTRNGGWVEGRDYINPAVQPIFDELAEKAWKDVTKV